MRSRYGSLRTRVQIDIYVRSNNERIYENIAYRGYSRSQCKEGIVACGFGIGSKKGQEGKAKGELGIADYMNRVRQLGSCGILRLRMSQ